MNSSVSTFGVVKRWQEEDNNQLRPDDIHFLVIICFLNLIWGIGRVKRQSRLIVSDGDKRGLSGLCRDHSCPRPNSKAEDIWLISLLFFHSLNWGKCNTVVCRTREDLTEQCLHYFKTCVISLNALRLNLSLTYWSLDPTKPISLAEVLRLRHWAQRGFLAQVGCFR